jgi:hypothetical protein
MRTHSGCNTAGTLGLSLLQPHANSSALVGQENEKMTKAKHVLSINRISISIESTRVGHYAICLMAVVSQNHSPKLGERLTFS